ncbi:MAG: glycosyltransferase family 4 protein [Candidatus Bathyarchaeota archaeon]|nr:glycosyltransferase family 4 protein [Candidatus Bathyarchaeota archaeon]
MTQTKLCIVTHTFLPHVGGIERVVYEQSKRLLKRQFELMVLTHRNYTTKSYNYDHIPVQCYEALNIGFRLGIPYPIPKVSSFRTFLQAVKLNDLVHAHGHPYLSSLAAAKLAKRYRKPFVLTQHNTFIDYKGMWNTVEWLNDAFVGKKVLKSADKIVAVSNATKNYVLSLGAEAEKIEVVYNGVDLDRFKLSPAAKEKIRKKHNIPFEAIVAVTVRRLVYKNGIDTLIEAAKTALRINKDLVFLVIGKGPDFVDIKAKIEQLGISHRFILAGFVPDEDLPDYYNAADFFVLPSKSGEGLPLVALEAMACGLPLLTTDVGGIKEIIINGYGKLVPPNMPKSLAEAILEFSTSVTTIAKEKLRNEVKKSYGWDANVDKMVKIYEEFI